MSSKNNPAGKGPPLPPLAKDPSPANLPPHKGWSGAAGGKKK